MEWVGPPSLQFRRDKSGSEWTGLELGACSRDGLQATAEILLKLKGPSENDRILGNAVSDLGFRGEYVFQLNNRHPYLIKLDIIIIKIYFIKLNSCWI
jgi:hypothetical protein